MAGKSLWRALVAGAVVVSMLVTGCAAGPVIGRILLQIGMQIAVTEGANYIEKWLHDDPPTVPTVTISFTNAEAVPSTVTYAVQKIRDITVKGLQGNVSITGSTCAWSITVAPGTLAEVEIKGEEGESIHCDGAVPNVHPPTSAVTTAGGAQCRAREFVRGQAELVEAGCTVQGDVEISNTINGNYHVYYDNDGATGLIVRMGAPGYVRAPFGGSATDLSAEQAAELMRSRGCSGGCARVDIVTWSG